MRIQDIQTEEHLLQYINQEGSPFETRVTLNGVEVDATCSIYNIYQKVDESVDRVEATLLTLAELPASFFTTSVKEAAEHLLAKNADIIREVNLLVNDVIEYGALHEDEHMTLQDRLEAGEADIVYDRWRDRQMEGAI